MVFAYWIYFIFYELRRNKVLREIVFFAVLFSALSLAAIRLSYLLIEGNESGLLNGYLKQNGRGLKS